MKKKNPLIAIIILNWNNWKDTLELLDSLEKISYSNYLTIMVDNGSFDDSVERIQEGIKRRGKSFVEYSSREFLVKNTTKEEVKDKVPSGENFFFIVNNENLGFTGGNNIAIDYCLNRQNPVDFVFLINNDAELEPDTLSKLVYISEEADAGVVGCVVKDKSTGKVRVSGYNGSYPLIRQFFQPLLRWEKPSYNLGIDFISSFWVSGVAVLIRKDFLEDIYSLEGRYLDDRLFLYGEDFELCYQANKIGYSIVTSIHSIVTHKKARSSGGKGGPIEFYYSNRNRILIANRILGLWIKIFFHPFNLVLSFGRVFKNLLQGKIQSANAVIWALIDGYRGKSGKWRKHDDFSIKERHEK